MASPNPYFILDSFEFPKSSRLDHFSGDLQVKDITTMKTLDSEIVFDWGAAPATCGTVVLSWDWMTNADYTTLYGKYISAGATYIFGIHSPFYSAGRTYIVDILECSGTPYQDVWQNIVLRLNLRSII